METDETEPTISEHTIVVPRTARYHTLGPDDGASELWIVCHGQGQLARRFLRHFSVIDDGTRLIVAPEAHSRYYIDPVAQQVGNPAPRIGASWMTKEFREHEIVDYVRYLELMVQEVLSRCTAQTRVIAFGFSQGAATISRWVAATTVRVEELVLWGGGLPPEIDIASWPSAMHDVRLSYVVGERDEYITPKVVANELARLEGHNVTRRFTSFPGGHEIDAEILVALSRGWSTH